MSKTRLESGAAADVTDLGAFLESRGGVAQTFPQSGAPVPGEKSASLMAAHLAEVGQELPMMKQDIGSLVKSKPAFDGPQGMA